MALRVYNLTFEAIEITQMDPRRPFMASRVNYSVS